MKLTFRSIRLLVMLSLFTCVTASFASSQIKPPAGQTSVQIKLAYAQLPSDFQVSTKSAYEISVASLRPGRTAQNQIVVSVGAPPQLYRLTATNGVIGDSGKGTEVTVPSFDKTTFGTDNQMVRLESNQFMFERDSATFRQFTARNAPAWAKENITGLGVIQPGQRGALSLGISSDGLSWSEKLVYDLGTQLSGKYGIPRPMDAAGNADVSFDKQGKNADGTKKWWIGGGDRTELYSCPFTGNLYLATRVISGPYQSGDAQQNTTLVLGSTDMGQSWKLITTHLAWSPTVLTSTQDGRLWMFQEAGTEPILYVTNPTTRLTLPSGIKTATIKSNSLSAAGPDKVDMELKIGHPSIARQKGTLTTSEVLLSYQIKNASGNQEFKIMKATINKSNEITSSTIDTLYAENRNEHSALYGTFIQPELVGEGTNRFSTDDTLFYWYKARREPSGTFAVQYAMFIGGKKTQSGFLSTNNHAKREWSTRKDPGDYMKGTSYFGADGVLNFVPFWVEPDGVHGTLLRKTPN